jgi:hypothetical protein
MGAMFFYGIFIRPDKWGWLGMMVLILGIEIDQATTWSMPNFWDWFIKTDTILDIVCGIVGYLLYRIIARHL